MQERVGGDAMKIDEVKGTGEIPPLAEQGTGTKAHAPSQAQRPPSPDQVTLSVSAQSTAAASAGRVDALRAELQRGLEVDPTALAKKLLDEGVVT